LVFVLGIITALTFGGLCAWFGLKPVMSATEAMRQGLPWEHLARSPRPLPYWPLLANFLSLPFVCGLAWCFRRFLDRRSWRSLGFEAGPAPGREVGAGVFLGVAVIALTVLPLFLAGKVEEVGWGGGPSSAGEWLGDVGIILVLMIAAAFLEELAVRAYILGALKSALGSVPAVIISSALFSALHAKNPGAGLVGLINILLAGLLLGTVFVVTERIWAAWALHAAWNLMLGVVLGLPVSGVELPALLRVRLLGGPLLTGGPFGLEASLWNSAALAAILISLLWLAPRLFGTKAVWADGSNGTAPVEGADSHGVSADQSGKGRC